MKILYGTDLITGIGNSFVFLDTTVFIAALNYREEFRDLFRELEKNGCEFLTIPS